MSVCVWACPCHGVPCVEVREQLPGVSFLLPSYGARDKVQVVRHQASLALSHLSSPRADFLCAVFLYIG